MTVDDSMTQRHSDEEPLVEIQLDRDSAQDGEDAAAYQCAVCQLAFPAQDVYESEGSIICTACWNRAQSAAAGAGGNKAASAPPPRPRPPARAPLLARITCPHCWHKFLPQDILWIASHGELIGDPVAGPDASLRFLPSSFTADGAARDARGLVCQSLACPNCHLIIPRPLVEIEPLFISIVGVASSGKSFFLSAMTWELRRLLPLHFGVSFSDAQPTFNRALNQQEEALFLPADPDRPVKLDKTETAGPLMYDQVRLGDQNVSLPRPCLFTMRPSGKHPNADYAAHLARVVALYDNAGEHFDPGADSASTPLTRHLGFSRVLMFVYDLTQDPRFRARCRGLSADPQLDEQFPTRRQETILIETANRVRHFAGLPAGKPVNRPLVVVIPKADVWGKLADLDLSKEPIVANCVANQTLAGVDLDRVESVSKIVRKLLLGIAPEFVAGAEEFSSNVVYIPISALGISPEIIGGRPGLWVRPSQLKPQWVTVPFLYMFARWTHDVIARVRWQRNKN
ncbi:MAG TPA: hypothetical protein VFE47_20480 [Tepidisphaeraceae bacterium]|jgi:hypothetical protein|nr:hypothetical protein [Tepidisphaeraceae bacterium]